MMGLESQYDAGGRAVVGFFLPRTESWWTDQVFYLWKAMLFEILIVLGLDKSDEVFFLWQKDVMDLLKKHSGIASKILKILSQ